MQRTLQGWPALHRLPMQDLTRPGPPMPFLWAGKAGCVCQTSSERLGARRFQQIYRMEAPILKLRACHLADQV